MSNTNGTGPGIGGNLTLGLASIVREEILGGKWPQQSRLPADSELARTFGVGMNTVRRALSVLVSEGLLERRHGSGTFVVGGPERSSTPFLIGLFVPSVRRYFSDLVAGVESTVHSHGGHLLLRSTEYNPTRELHQLDELLLQRPDGLVLTPTLVGGLADPEAYMRRIEDLGVPVVLAERLPLGASGNPHPHSPVSWVTSDTRRGGYLAAQHLHELGRRRVGLMSSRNTPTSEGFHQGFIEAVHDFDMVADRGIVRWPPCSGDQMAKYVEDYAAIAQTHQLEGVVCLDDLRAQRLVAHLLAAGMSIPDDVAIVAYEDQGKADAEIPLTVVVPARHEVGRMAAQILLNQIERGHSQPVTQVVVAPELVVRASTVRRTDRRPGARTIAP